MKATLIKAPEAKPDYILYATSATSRVYHHLTRVPRCKDDYRLGTVMAHYTMCGKEFFDEELFKGAIPKVATECTRCGHVRIERERAAIQAAEREIRTPTRASTDYFPSFEEALKEARALAPKGSAIQAFEVEAADRHSRSLPTRWRGTVSFLSKEQVALLTDDATAKAVRS